MTEVTLEQSAAVHAKSLRAPMARRPGRPSGLDDARLGRFFEAIGAGLRPTAAARVAGISTNTLAGWIKRGRGADPTRPATAEYIRFVETIQQCEANAEFEVVKTLVSDLKGRPGAAIRWLETRWPETYGRSRRDLPEDDPNVALSGQPEPPAVVTDGPPTRSLVIPVDQLGDFAHRIMLYQRGVEVAPSLAGLSSGPDDDFESDVGQ